MILRNERVRKINETVFLFRAARHQRANVFQLVGVAQSWNLFLVCVDDSLERDERVAANVEILFGIGRVDADVTVRCQHRSELDALNRSGVSFSLPSS